MEAGMKRLRFLLIVAVLTVNFSLGDTVQNSGPGTKRTTLTNGLTVILLEKHQLPMVEGLLVVKSGALADPRDKEGLASLVCNLLTKGTSNRTREEIESAVDATGGDLQTRVDWDSSQISFHVLKKEMPKLLKLVADLVQHPALPAAEIKREKDLTLERIHQIGNDNWRTADRWFYRILYKRSRLSLLPQGEDETVSKIELPEVEQFYKANYFPGNCVLMLGGDVGGADLGLVKDNFSEWKGSGAITHSIPDNTPEINENSIWMVDKPDMSQAQIRIGHKGISRQSPDYLPTEVLNTLLGGGFSSRLMEELRRKRGLSYGVQSQFEYGKTGGTFYIWTFASNPKVGEVIELILEELAKMQRGEISDQEIGAVEQYLQGVEAMRLESPADIENRMVDFELNGLSLSSFFSYGEDIKKVAAKDVRRAAGKYLLPEGNVIVILGRRSEIETQLHPLKGKLNFVSAKD
jgi:zinc protease